MASGEQARHRHQSSKFCGQSTNEVSPSLDMHYMHLSLINILQGQVFPSETRVQVILRGSTG